MLKQLLFIVVISCYNLLFSQELINFTEKDGLPSNNIYQITQDLDGFIWIATNRGVVKYDGASFKTFTIQDGLPTNDIYLLEVDSKGRVWFLSKSKYQGFIKNDTVNKFLISNDKVITAKVISKSDSFFSINNHQFIKNKFSKKSTSLKIQKNLESISIKYDVSKKDIMYFKEYQRYLILKDNNVILIDSNQEIIVQRKITFNISKEKIINNSNWGLIYDEIYLISFEKGILLLDAINKNIEFVEFNILFHNIGNINYLTTNISNNEIQISGSNFNATFDKNFKLLSKRIFPKTPYIHNTFKDTDNNYWRISDNKGLFLEPNHRNYTKYNFLNKKNQKICVIDSTIYSCVNNEGIFLSKKNLLQTKMKIKHTTFYKIAKNALNDDLIIVSTKAIYRIHDNSLEQISILNEKNQEESGFKDFFVSKHYNYGIRYTGAFKTNKGKNKIIQFKNKQGLNKIIEFNKEIFIGGNDGFYKIVKGFNFKEDTSLVDIPVISLITSKNGIYIGTNGKGIFYSNGNFSKQIKSTNGYSIQKIVVNKNHIWAATQKGIIKLNISKDVSKSTISDHFYNVDGLLQNNCNDMFLKDSLIYVASDNGISVLNIYNPSYKNKPKIFYPFNIDSITVAYRNSSTIEVKFSVLDLLNTPYHKYYYRINQITNKWKQIENKSVVLSNLSPKKYTIEFKVIDHHNNEQISKFSINIIPEWWQTIYAKIAYSLSIIVILFLIANYVKVKNKKKSEHKIKIAGLELQALRSQMNPHFVHNSLNSIQYYIQNNNIELSEYYLSSFSKLIRMFFEYSRRQKISVAEEIQLLEKYLDIEKLRFEDKLTYKVKCDKRIDIYDYYIPSMLLQPIVENSVNHGVFHKIGQGIIEIDFIFIDINTIVITIKDDGIGINKAKKIYSSSSNNYQSKSSKVIKERLLLINENKNYKIDFTTKDLSDFSEQTGTETFLRITQLV